MRFSVLTLNLHTWQEQDQLGKIDRIARYIAEENVTSVCLQECGQRTDSSLIEESDTVRQDNTGHLLTSRLAELGLKYSMVWAFSHHSFDDYEEGSAVLTQLPILGSCSRYVSSTADPDTADARKVIMARLAVAPNAVIDLYSTHLSSPERGLGEQIESLLSFVDETPNILEQMKPPPPKRRGPPRRRAPVEEPVISTRLVCVAGDMNETPDGLVSVLKTRGFLDATAVARDRESGTGTFEDGRWIDYVYIKPALRPLDARVAFTGRDRPVVSDHYGVIAEFEV